MKNRRRCETQARTKRKAEGGVRACSPRCRTLLSKHPNPRRGALYNIYQVYAQKPLFFRTSATCIFRARVTLSRSRLRGIEGAPPVPYTHAEAPTGLRGARSGLSESRWAGYSRRAGCRRARAKRFHRNPTLPNYLSSFRSAAVSEVPQ